MVHPDNTPAVTGADAGTSVTPEAEEPTQGAAPDSGPTNAEVPTDAEIVDSHETLASPGEDNPPGTTSVAADSEIVDAELVPTPIAPTTSTTRPGPAPVFDYTDSRVPTPGYLQDKSERRYGNALGGTELAGATPEVQSAAKAQEARDKAAADKLEEIRRSLHPDS